MILVPPLQVKMPLMRVQGVRIKENSWEKRNDEKGREYNQD